MRTLFDSFGISTAKGKFMKKLLATLVFFILSVHAYSFDKTVDFVDIDRFMGKWHVVAGRFTALEKNMYNAVETYNWNPVKNRIEIDFKYNKGSFNGPVKKIPQKGWIQNTTTNAHWIVSPLWPLKFDYLVIGLGEDYEWTAIGVPSEAYLWIMSRDPHMTKDKVDEILRTLENNKYNIENLVFVEHDDSIN
jgi:apolipoprotein D and lipocalin family protein